MDDSFDTARKALGFLQFHHLTPTPDHYAFAMAFVTGRDSALAHAVAAETDGGVRLTPDAVERLARRLIAPAPAEAARQATVVRQTEQLGVLTADAQQLTTTLSNDVSAMTSEAHGWPDAGGLVTRLSEAERELAALREDFVKLQADIGALHERGIETQRDPLTQSLNQQGAMPVLAALAEQGRPYVMMLYSVADIVGINARFGHAVGNNVLNAFTATLRQVFPGEEVIRWTGNEFLIVKTDLALAAARILTAEVLTAFHERRLKLRGTGEWIGPVTASAGIVVGQDDTIDAVLTRARVNLSRAAGRGESEFEG